MLLLPTEITSRYNRQEAAYGYFLRGLYMSVCVKSYTTKCRTSSGQKQFLALLY